MSSLAQLPCTSLTESRKFRLSKRDRSYSTELPQQSLHPGRMCIMPFQDAGRRFQELWSNISSGCVLPNVEVARLLSCLSSFRHQAMCGYLLWALLILACLPLPRMCGLMKPTSHSNVHTYWMEILPTMRAGCVQLAGKWITPSWHWIFNGLSSPKDSIILHTWTDEEGKTYPALLHQSYE